MNIEELDVVNKESDHLMDIIIDPLTEEQVESPKENTIFAEIAKEDPIIEFPYIDFVIGVEIRRSCADGSNSRLAASIHSSVHPIQV